MPARQEGDGEPPPNPQSAPKEKPPPQNPTDASGG